MTRKRAQRFCDHDICKSMSPRRSKRISEIAEPLEHFQEKCEAVFRQEMRKNKEIERFCDSV
ncbi:hypothetical protein AC244_12715 [Ensifer adhaerens]|uniref:Uncharacterized protein n=1 Tax=Ensifer adhaerens TaxID=106592 RepID=A0A0L8BWI9_ENSAD|nr:hypothetical protein AC244_12715 [Ensifer adhaerens]